MQKRVYLLGVIILLSVTGFTQIPVDYGNPVIHRGQGNTTRNFMNFLEQGKVDNALSVIDSSFIKARPRYRDSLVAYYKELSKYLKITELSVVIVYLESKYNTYRCRYHNSKGEFFYMDLYYNVGQPNSPIAKIMKKPEKELIKERKELAKRLKEEEKNGSPPIPPPPPPLEMKQVK